MSERNKGFMMIPNKMWEKLYEIRVPMQQRRVFDYIYRQTIGYPIHPRNVSTFDIAETLGIDSADVRDLVVELVKKNMVVRNGIYKEIMKDYTLWMVGEPSPTIKQGKAPLVSRGKTPCSVGEDSPLRKETLKEKEKKDFLSKKVREKKRKEMENGKKMFLEAINKPEEREKKNQ